MGKNKWTKRSNVLRDNVVEYKLWDKHCQILYPINPVIGEVFKNIYLTDEAQPLEDMINKFYHIMNGSIFGGLFETYMILKFQNENFEFAKINEILFWLAHR